jgi:hypothetical protein
VGLNVRDQQFPISEPCHEPVPGVVNSRTPPFHREPRIRSLLPLLLASICFAATCGTSRAQSPALESPDPSAADRIQKLEQLVDTVVQENRRLFDEVRDLKDQLNSRPQGIAGFDSAANPTFAAGPNPDDASSVPADSEPESWARLAADQPVGAPGRLFGNFRSDYDNGFIIKPENLDETPFSLKINSQDMFRYDGFSRGATSWTDSTGSVVPITNSNNFQIPRGRLIFSGKVFFPELSYLLNIDYNTVTNNPLGFRAYVLSYRFSRAFTIHMGQSKVPGTREWIESAFAPLEGPDRTMATTFFRPSLSQGIWFTGQPLDGLYYHAMMSNGFNTLNLRPVQLNNKFCWSGSVWWEPWGDFGRGYADLEAHERPAIRIGSSYTFALGQGSQSASDAVENSSIRLSDGTLLTQTGAIAPGVTLKTYDISLAAFDFSYKYQGWSFSTEWFLQNLTSLVGDGPLPIDATQAYGAFVQGGYFVLPQTVELYSRTSWVTGHFGSGSELAGGVNWFIIPGKSNMRFTCDTAWLKNSPADQNRTGFVAGQTGILFRTQLTIAY